MSVLGTGQIKLEFTLCCSIIWASTFSYSGVFTVHPKPPPAASHRATEEDEKNDFFSLGFQRQGPLSVSRYS